MGAVGGFNSYRYRSGQKQVYTSKEGKTVSQFLVYDRNNKRVLGIYPTNGDATTATRDFKAKNEGKHCTKLILETLTASDPDFVGNKSDTDK